LRTSVTQVYHFDAGKSITDLGNKKPKDRYQKEKDSNIKAELKKGNILEIIEDSLNY